MSRIQVLAEGKRTTDMYVHVATDIAFPLFRRDCFINLHCNVFFFGVSGKPNASSTASMKSFS